jgi:hypothetical protein
MWRGLAVLLSTAPWVAATFAPADLSFALLGTVASPGLVLPSPDPSPLPTLGQLTDGNVSTCTGPISAPNPDFAYYWRMDLVRRSSDPCS